MKENKLTPFSFLKGMTETKAVFDFSLNEVKTAYKQFLLNRYLSSIRIFIPLVVVVNRMGVIPDEMHYEFFKSKLPERKFYFKYLSRKKELNEHEIVCISDYYEISRREAKIYLEILNTNQIKEITNKFKHGVGK